MSWKNQILRLAIDDVNPDGNGVGRAESGMVVFVPLAVPGDVCDVLIIKETSGFLIGKLISLITPSPFRVQPSCPAFGKCGSCAFLHVSEEYENELKREIARKAFLRIAKMDVEVEKTRSFGMERYRNKVVYPLVRNGNRCSFGYYARHSHSVVPHDDCPLQDSRFAEIAGVFCRLADRLHVPVWNESASSGILRHLCVRKSRAGTFWVTVVAAKRFRGESALAQELAAAFPCISGVFLNLNPAPGNVIFGEETVSLLGERVQTDVLCGRELFISPVSFYQINADCAENMYDTAAELLNLAPEDVLLDLFCGIGTIGLSIVSDRQSLFGVELNPDAVRDAWSNAERCGRTDRNTFFVCGDASFGIQACNEKFGRPQAIIVDPPRKGLSDETIRSIVDSNCPKLLYISCNPATLAKNCADLCLGHYFVQKVLPFNMFLRTGHVECVTLIAKK